MEVSAILAANLALVRERIAAAALRSGRGPEAIRILAVTKTEEPGILPALMSLGLADFGENRVEHLLTMATAAPVGARFHAIGRVQGRQLARVAPIVCSLHSLCEAHHAEKLARACQGLGKRMDVFLQVNSGGEEQKSGVEPAELDALLDALRGHRDWLEVQGLMTMAPDRDLPGVTPDRIRECFARLRTLAQGHGLPRLSMGMSKDFEIAVEEGATDLRLGSVLFEGLHGS